MAITDPFIPDTWLDRMLGERPVPTTKFPWLYRNHTKYQTGQKSSSVQGCVLLYGQLFTTFEETTCLILQ